MIRKVEGIVISSVNYKESSKIINILTKNDGIIGVLAQGSRKIKSNIGSTSDILTYGIFHIKTINKNKHNLLEVDVIDNFKTIRKDIIKTNYAIYLLELTSQVYKHDNNKEIYNLLITGLKKINAGLDEGIISLIIELKLLYYLGIKPNIDNCVSCGNSHDIVTISSYKGGYLCKNCSSGEKIYNIKTLKLIKMFYYVDLNKVTKIEISPNIRKELNLFVDDYYDRYSGLYLKSKSLLEEFSNINN